jgi:poly(3-hydroxybutyrate) depolymerase
MTEYILPTMNASSNIAMVGGFSSGATMSSLLVIAYPDMFRGGAFFNGLLPGFTMQQFGEYYKWDASPEGPERQEAEDNIYNALNK